MRTNCFPFLAALALFAWSCGTGPGTEAARDTRALPDAAEHAGDGSQGNAATPASTTRPALDRAHLDRVMTSAFCASCHPDIYAEHEQSTHGRAFTDEEARLATARFSHQDCIICHTPRPIFETGVGQNPMRRWHDLEEGNTCMTCHWKPGVDYSRFQGGAECKTAFHPDVGSVEACASCHRNHGTPYQWEKSPIGKGGNRPCIQCHMALEERPIAVGAPARRVRTHVFPGSRNEKHLRRAYEYEACIDGNEVVVRLKNKGAGHNFPTELKQRSVESLVVVKDLAGREVARSRMVFRDPYKRPYGLDLPVNTQIPSGQEREHRVPIKVADGTVECELFYKLYFPIEDGHPDLSRQLETRRLLFDKVTPSDKEVVSAPDVRPVAPESIGPEAASPANLVDFARPPIGKVEVDIPSGSSPDDIKRLIDLFQFPVPQANGAARKRLTEIGAPAIPALMEALGSWDNKTFNQSLTVLEAIGAPALPAAVKALTSDQLYVRVHARLLLARFGVAKTADGTDVAAAVAAGIKAPHPLDRASVANALGELGAKEHAAAVRTLLEDADWDVVRAAARALARLGDHDAAAIMARVLSTATWPETRCDLAFAMARLGNADGIPVLITGLDYRDDLIRESFFESLFATTGMHHGYDPLAPRDERLAAISRIATDWARNGGIARLAAHGKPADKKARALAVKLITDLGGSDMEASTPEKDQKMVEQLVEMGGEAVPALVNGLKWPPGFADKRQQICTILGRIGSAAAAPALAATLRDPVLHVATTACTALDSIGDQATLPAVVRFEQRIRSLAEAGHVPEGNGPVDRLVALTARTRLKLGDTSARTTLVGLLLSEDVVARKTAIEGLQQAYGQQRGYDPEDPIEDRRAAVARWLKP